MRQIKVLKSPPALSDYWTFRILLLMSKRPFVARFMCQFKHCNVFLLFFQAQFFMGRHKCEAVACLSSQLKCKFFYVFYFSFLFILHGEYDMIYDMIIITTYPTRLHLLFLSTCSFCFSCKKSDIIIIFQDFPSPLLFSITFQASKMVF